MDAHQLRTQLIPEPRRSDEDRAAVPAMRRLAQGAVAGLHATAVMTLFRLPVTDSLPPTAEFWARFVGDGDPDDYPGPALALHLLYGTCGGVGFAALFDRVARATTVQRERRGALLGSLYGIGLSAVGRRVILEGFLEMDLDADERWVFLVSHVVYGLALGTWLGSRLRPEA